MEFKSCAFLGKLNSSCSFSSGWRICETRWELSSMGLELRHYSRSPRIKMRTEKSNEFNFPLAAHCVTVAEFPRNEIILLRRKAR